MMTLTGQPPLSLVVPKLRDELCGSYEYCCNKKQQSCTDYEFSFRSVFVTALDLPIIIYFNLCLTSQNASLNESERNTHTKGVTLHYTSFYS